MVKSQTVSKAPAPQRRWAWAENGDDWNSIAARVFPERPVAEAVTDLQQWNLHLVFRPPSVPMTSSDILMVEPPVA